MDVASLIVLLLVAIAVWYAIRTLRRDGGGACRGCRDAHCCRKNNNSNTCTHK